MRIASPREERGHDRRLVLPQPENGRHRTAARARRQRARVSRRARDALRGHAGPGRRLAGARAPQRAVGRVPRGRMDPRPGRRRASHEGRRLLADAAGRAAWRPRARRALRRARHLRAAARGVPAGGLGAGRGDPRPLTRSPARRPVAPGRGLTVTGHPPRRHRRLRAVRPLASVVDDSLRAWPFPSRVGDTLRGVADRYVAPGGAGCIGGHVGERLLAAHPPARVRVFDDFSSGSMTNLPFAAAAGERLEVVRGDVRDLAAMEHVARNASVIFHQAAMRSVPRSVNDPLGANDHNVNGTLHVLEAARRASVRRVVYASSSSVYGDNPALPKREDQTMAPISPYAVSKAANELYASVWTKLYGVETVGLRYFNVFGPRQDPASEYAAVIPKFILWGLRDEALEVHGDGRQSRDFTYIDNVVDANLLAARAPDVGGEVFNVGGGERVSLLEIIARLEQLLGRPLTRRHTPGRAGDVPHTLADVSKGKRLLGYSPLVNFDEGLARTVTYFRDGGFSTPGACVQTGAPQRGASLR